MKEQVKYLAEILKEYGLSSVEVETEEMSIKLKKYEKPVHVPYGFAQAPVASVAPVEAAAPLAASEAPPAPKIPSGKLVKAPLVGTFYAAPGVGKEPYVKVGDTVKKGQVIGIIEAMKLMNEIESDVDGVVAEILVENGKMVEYGQPIISVK